MRGPLGEMTWNDPTVNLNFKKFLMQRQNIQRVNIKSSGIMYHLLF